MFGGGLGQGQTGAQLQAGLDRLAAVKEVAQVAAVIGRVFPYELLEAVAGLSEKQLGDALRQLADAGLVFRRGDPPNATYVFKHALVQETAYNALLRAPREEIHGRIARTLASDFPEVMEANPELIANHYTQAGLDEEAVEFWREAGPAMWFAKDAAFDRRFRERFLSLHEAAARGELEHWLANPTGAMALLILLDQFPRNSFRGTPRMYDTDASARPMSSQTAGPRRSAYARRVCRRSRTAPRGAAARPYSVTNVPIRPRWTCTQRRPLNSTNRCLPAACAPRRIDPSISAAAPANRPCGEETATRWRPNAASSWPATRCSV